jgi:hypothetical protein
MDASQFDEIEFFRAIEASSVRALLIGRRALVLLGLPLLTADQVVSQPDGVLSEDTLARILAVSDRQCTAEEIAAALGAPVTDDERDRILSLVA